MTTKLGISCTQKLAHSAKIFLQLAKKNCAKRAKKPCSQIYRLSEITLTDFSLLVEKCRVARYFLTVTSYQVVNHVDGLELSKNLYG